MQTKRQIGVAISLSDKLEFKIKTTNNTKRVILSL